MYRTYRILSIFIWTNAIFFQGGVSAAYSFGNELSSFYIAPLSFDLVGRPIGSHGTNVDSRCINSEWKIAGECNSASVSQYFRALYWGLHIILESDVIPREEVDNSNGIYHQFAVWLRNHVLEGNIEKLNFDWNPESVSKSVLESLVNNRVMLLEKKQSLNIWDYVDLVKLFENLPNQIELVRDTFHVSDCIGLDPPNCILLTHLFA